jgi:thiol peroxidase
LLHCDFAGKDSINIFQVLTLDLRAQESLMKVGKRKHQYCVFQEILLCSKTFCGAEGLENVINLSDFNSGIL